MSLEEFEIKRITSLGTVVLFVGHCEKNVGLFQEKVYKKTKVKDRMDSLLSSRKYEKMRERNRIFSI